MRRAASLLVFLSLLSCGYRLQGTGGTLPATARVVAVTAFERKVPVLELDQRVTQAVTREMAQRARVRVQATPEGADAVLRGAVIGYGQIPVSFDPADGRANRFRVEMDASVTFTDAAGKVLYKNEGFHFEAVYDRSTPSGTVIQQETVAYDDIARDFARALVSAILEGEPAP